MVEGASTGVMNMCMRKEVTVGQVRLACVCPMSAIRSQMGLRDGMGGGGKAGRNDWHFVLEIRKDGGYNHTHIQHPHPIHTPNIIGV